MIELLNCDCMEYMATQPDNAFDLAIVDPPYGIGVNSMNMGSRQTVRPDSKKWDDTTPPHEYFDELKRVSRNRVIWGGNYFHLPQSRCFFIWDKGEMMYGRSFAECEMAWTSFYKSARIIKINPTQLDRIHPTQKPVKLYEWVLREYGKPGIKIIDTHLGSGSSAIAAHYFGCDFVGMEIDKEYYDAAKARFERETRQLAMF